MILLAFFVASMTTVVSTLLIAGAQLGIAALLLLL